MPAAFFLYGCSNSHSGRGVRMVRYASRARVCTALNSIDDGLEEDGFIFKERSHDGLHQGQWQALETKKTTKYHS